MAVGTRLLIYDIHLIEASVLAEDVRFLVYN